MARLTRKAAVVVAAATTAAAEVERTLTKATAAEVAEGLATTAAP